MSLRVSLVLTTWFLGVNAYSQADSLVVDSLFSWEEQWLIWCEQSACISTDTSLWNGMAEPGLELDTASMKARLEILDRFSELDLRWNPVAHTRIAYYVKRRKQGLGTMLGRARQYFPLFEEILDREGLPLELKYLTVVESGLNPEARSHAGARGLWQFMYYTAKAEGLRDTVPPQSRCP